MDIVIIADYLGPLDGSYNSRFLYLGDLLAKEHSVEVVTGNFNHGKKERFTGDIEQHSYPIIMLDEPGYPKNTCLRRFWSDYIWGKNVRTYLNSRKKPDVVYSACPPLTGAREAAVYCRKKGVRFVIDIQDLWPEAFQMVFNIPFASDVIFAPFKKAADKIYGAADEVIAVSQTYVDRALSVITKVKTGYSVFLGTRLETFDRNVSENPETQKPDNEIWLGYCGTLGSSYDIRCVIDALKIVNDGRIRFVVMGDGPRREEFETYAKEKGVHAEFTGSLPYPVMCGKLAACDVTVNPIKGKSAASIINKHTDYAASGLPVINTQESPEYRDLVEEYDMGFNCNNGDPVDMAEKLTRLMNDAQLRQKMGRNARRCAEEKFDRKDTYQKLIKVIEKRE